MRSVKNTERRLTNRNFQTVIVCAPTVNQDAVNRIAGGISEYLFVRQPYTNDGEVALIDQPLGRRFYTPAGSVTSSSATAAVSVICRNSLHVHELVAIMFISSVALPHALRGCTLKAWRVFDADATTTTAIHTGPDRSAGPVCETRACSTPDAVWGKASAETALWWRCWRFPT